MYNAWPPSRRRCTTCTIADATECTKIDDAPKNATLQMQKMIRIFHDAGRLLDARYACHVIGILLPSARSRALLLYSYDASQTPRGEPPQEKKDWPILYEIAWTSHENARATTAADFRNEPLRRRRRSGLPTLIAIRYIDSLTMKMTEAYIHAERHIRSISPSDP